MLIFLGRIILACAFFGMTTLVHAKALAPSGIVLSSGVPGGGYWKAGSRLREVAASELGIVVESVPSLGSRDNLEKLLDMESPVNVAFVQADAAQYYLNTTDPSAASALELIENIGEECVFIITGKNSDLWDEGDLETGDNLRLGIPSVDSGVAFTFDYMASQVNGLLDISVRYGDTLPMIMELNNPEASVDAVMMVHRPRELSPEVEYALSDLSNYRFVELDDRSLSQTLWNGRKVYRAMHLAMPGVEKPVNTICVLGVLLANKHKLNLEQRNFLSELANYHWMKVYVTP